MGLVEKVARRLAQCDGIDWDLHVPTQEQADRNMDERTTREEYIERAKAVISEVSFALRDEAED